MLSLRWMKQLQVETFHKEHSVVVRVWVRVPILASSCVNLGTLFDISVLHKMSVDNNNSTTFLGLL